MKLNYITFLVRDIKKAVSFYQNLAGLQTMDRLDLEAGEIVFLANAKGETMLELVGFEGAEKVMATGMVISFLAEGDLKALREKALALGYSPSDIITKAPKPKHFTVADPDGLVVEFCN
ncbi:MAG: VOC family protein [Clostridiales bacterium]|nr:VOC family protein [Clostridiales bacterium]